MALTKNMRYDDPNYTVVDYQAMGEAGGGATTNYGRFVAMTSMIVKSFQVGVTVAGTATAHAFTLNKIAANGTATTSIGAVTLSTNTVGYATNVALTANPTLAAGDQLFLTSGADAVGKAAWGVELLNSAGASFTA